MKILQSINHAIKKYFTPSEDKLLNKAFKLYRHYSSYVHLQHTPRGYSEALERQEHMRSMLLAISSMTQGDERRQKLMSTISTFKKYNRISFR